MERLYDSFDVQNIISVSSVIRVLYEGNMFIMS